MSDFCKRINATKGVKRCRSYGSEERYIVRNEVVLFDEIGKSHTTIRANLRICLEPLPMFVAKNPKLMVSTIFSPELGLFMIRRNGVL